MRLLLVLGITTAFAIPAVTQDFTAPPGAPAKIFPKPQRPVADIVGPIWYEEKERDVARETQQVVRLLGIKSGMTIADIGAGSGYYVVRLAPIVGASGRIFAEDVVPEYLRALRKRLRKRGLQNVTIILGEPHDASLPAHSIDRAILVHMYQGRGVSWLGLDYSFRSASPSIGLISWLRANGMKGKTCIITGAHLAAESRESDDVRAIADERAFEPAPPLDDQRSIKLL